jgi:hypothetical protein
MNLMVHLNKIHLKLTIILILIFDNFQ